MKSEIINIGVVGVDSGQLIICDPCYIEKEFKISEPSNGCDHAHTIYRHIKTGELWQFTYTGKGAPGVNPFPGNYEMIISKYGKSPNQLIECGEFVETDEDPTPHIKKGEFSYPGICKETRSDKMGGQLNYQVGHPGAAVAFSTGLGDGLYEIFAEIVETKKIGKRVKKVWVEFLSDEVVASLNK